MTKIKWTKDVVIKEILSLKKRRIDLNASHIRDNYLSLFKGANNRFGNWGNAIRASGLEYETIRRDRKTESYKGLVFQALLAEVFMALSLPFKPGHSFTYINERCVPDFISNNGKIWADAKIRSWTVGTEQSIKKYLKRVTKVHIFYIGGGKRKWKTSNVKFICVKDFFNELKAIGRNDLVSKIQTLEIQNGNTEQFKIWSEKWSKELILAEILKLYKNNIPLNDAYMNKNHNALRSAAMKSKYFGSWKNAVEAAGIRYKNFLKVVPSPYKDKNSVIKKILELYSECNLTAKNVMQSEITLYHSAIVQFGSFKEALRMAGVDYEKTFLTKKLWSKSKIILGLKELHTKKVRLSYVNIRQHNPKLAAAIDSKRYYKDLNEARKRAGIKFTKVHWRASVKK